MDFIARINLRPSFHDRHEWSVALSSGGGEVAGKCFGAEGAWRLSERDSADLPPELRTGRFPDDEYRWRGLDGIRVAFAITAGGIHREKEIWCPRHHGCPEYAALLHWCWHGLYKHSPDAYRLRLEQLHGYFDWGLPIRGTANGLRIFGGLVFGEDEGLGVKQRLDEIADLPAPEIDMTNFEGMGTRLYPVFKKFFERAPDSIWRVNAKASRQLGDAGIPASSMVLVRSH